MVAPPSPIHDPNSKDASRQAPKYSPREDSITNRTVMNNLKWTTEEEGRLRRKMDFRILPFISLLYLFSYLDRVESFFHPNTHFVLSPIISVIIVLINIGHAVIANAETKESLLHVINLTPSQYAMSISVFFITYVLFEIPSNLMFKKISPSLFTCIIMVSWGIVSTATAFVKDFSGLMICRLLMGAAESGFVPGMVYYLSFWYKPSEQAFRLVLFFCSATAAGAFSGLLAYLISRMNGVFGLYGWQWIFLLEGLPSIILGIVSYFFMPSDPSSASFLTEREKQIAAERIQSIKMPLSLEEQQQFKDNGKDKISPKEFLAALTNSRTWAFSLMALAMMTPVYSFTFFFPSQIKNMGFTSLRAQILSAPPYVVGLFFSIWFAWNADRTQDRRWHLSFAFTVVSIGFFLLSFVLDSIIAKYIVTFICINFAISTFPPALAWHNGFLIHASHTTKATCIAMMVSLANVAGVVAPFVYTFMRKNKGSNFNERGTTLQEQYGHLICGFCMVFALIMANIIGVIFDPKKRL